MKYYTIEEADTALPLVEKFLKKAQRLRDKISWLLETNEVVLEVSSDEGFHYFVTEQVKANKQFHKLYYQFYKVIEGLNEMGIIVKDIDDGLVDFPFRVNGDDAYLCWQLGEQKIRYWHDCESGYENRQPIVDVDELFQ
jgi:hypothetical protein